VFGQWLCDEAAQDDRLLAITPAMCEGSGMVQFANNTLNVSLMLRLLNNMQ
jgi:deoxyxylulose-5-phosphate synthase